MAAVSNVDNGINEPLAESEDGEGGFRLGEAIGLGTILPCRPDLSVGESTD